MAVSFLGFYKGGVASHAVQRQQRGQNFANKTGAKFWQKFLRIVPRWSATPAAGEGIRNKALY